MTAIYRPHAHFSACAIGLAMLSGSPAQARDYVQLSTGADYSSGDYGDTQKTDIVAAPFSVKLQKGEFFLRASLPYIYIKGPGGVVPGDGGAVPGGTPGAVTAREGIGDLSVSAGYSLPVTGSTYFILSGKVKAPTASKADGLGTGTTDITAQGELMQQFGMIAVSVRGGRRFNGSNSLFPLRNVWQAGAGVYFQTGPAVFGLDYDWRQASLPTASDKSEATGSLTYKLSSQLRLQAYGYTGSTNGSPNAGGGLQLLYRFGL